MKQHLTLITAVIVLSLISLHASAAGDLRTSNNSAKAESRGYDYDHPETQPATESLDLSMYARHGLLASTNVRPQAVAAADASTTIVAKACSSGPCWRLAIRCLSRPTLGLRLDTASALLAVKHLVVPYIRSPLRLREISVILGIINGALRLQTSKALHSFHVVPKCNQHVLRLFTDLSR